MGILTALERSFTIEEFVAVKRGSLRGFARVALASGLVLHDVSVHQDSGRAWAMPASKPMLDRNGDVMRDGDNKVRYAPIITFASREARSRFSDGVVAAVRVGFPEAYP